MGRQPGDSGTGREPGPDLPGGGPDSPGGPAADRGSCAAGFAKGGAWDSHAPSAALAAVLERASGPDERCGGAGRDEIFGMLRQWQALESWAAAGKLAALRALIRADDLELPGRPRHADLPDEWSRSLTREVSLALAMPAQSAERLMQVAWDLQARLPGLGGLLAGGKLTYAKAKAVADALEPLSEADAAAAEAMVLDDLPGKTYGQAEKLAALAAVTVDPQSASRRRQDAELNRSRVTMFREASGAAGLSGRDLPADQALAAHAQVCARAQEYKDSGAFPGARMDQFRACAYLDLLSEITARARIAAGRLATGTDPDEAATGGCGDQGGDPGDNAPGTAPDSDDPGDGGPGDDRGGPPGSAGGACVAPPRLTDLVIPLATLLGLGERPGEGHGLGILDPDLCRALAASAAASPFTTLCLTVTDPAGIAIGHGCARNPRAAGYNMPAMPGGLPSRVNLTVPHALLARLAAVPAGSGPPGTRAAAGWALSPPGTSDTSGMPARPGSPGTRGSSSTRGSPGGPGDPPWCGTWTLVIPGGAYLRVRLDPVPTRDCDHRYETRAYQPGRKLRHLVQVRDGDCTFPTCSRHARESDFDHALPYHKGGRTCACNAGARSRQCHQAKQSPGWKLTQPRPGWHRWETPSGRVYVQGPKRYPG